ncbi:MAG: hypothetical protein MUD01_13670 [Chloroflexaceae bacterium]|nr:hypothetical protein [Chloroflexaceae bacterium]
MTIDGRLTGDRRPETGAGRVTLRQAPFGFAVRELDERQGRQAQGRRSDE